jgi:hypothetical protein
MMFSLPFRGMLPEIDARSGLRRMKTGAEKHQQQHLFDDACRPHYARTAGPSSYAGDKVHTSV